MAVTFLTNEDALGFVHTTEQTLTEEQKAQARANINAAAVGEGVGSYELTEEDKAEIVASVLESLPNAEEAEF